MDLPPSPPPPGAPRTSGFAITSLVFGILGIVGGLTAIPAVVFGHLSLSRIRKSEGALTGRGLGIAGLALGYFWAVVMVASVFLALPVAQDAARSTKSLSNARQILVACHEYAQDHDGRFPPTLDDLVPDYVQSRKVFTSAFQADDDGPGFAYVVGLTTGSPGETIVLRERYV